MEENLNIKEKLAELLDTHYNGSFAQLVCEYIRLSGISAKEVEEVLEDVKRSQGLHTG